MGQGVVNVHLETQQATLPVIIDRGGGALVTVISNKWRRNFDTEALNTDLEQSPVFWIVAGDNWNDCVTVRYCADLCCTVPGLALG